MEYKKQGPHKKIRERRIEIKRSRLLEQGRKVGRLSDVVRKEFIMPEQFAS
jgi:hypothetical protein